MILTAFMEWSDRPSSNYCLGHWIKKRDSGRQEGAAAEKAVPFSAPLFDPKPLLAFASTLWAWLENQQLRPKRNPR
jgi:hypothetical protein